MRLKQLGDNNSNNSMHSFLKGIKSGSATIFYIMEHQTRTFKHPWSETWDKHQAKNTAQQICNWNTMQRLQSSLKNHQSASVFFFLNNSHRCSLCNLDSSKAVFAGSFFLFFSDSPLLQSKSTSKLPIKKYMRPQCWCGVNPTLQP